MDKQVVYEKIKKARRQRVITNCYSMDVVGRCSQMWSYEEDFIFSYEDHGVNRLVFFVNSWNRLNQLLAGIESERYYLEFMTKDPKEFVPDNSTEVAAMMRLSNPDCRNVFEIDSPVIKYKDTVNVENAIEQDAKEINKVLWSTFHTEISHLLYDDELREKIRNRNITIHRDIDSHIDAILQVDIMPKRFYINQVVNKSNRDVIHAILLKRLEEYVEAGGKYLYAWVEHNNSASIKFHGKYGMRHDGMWSMIYSIDGV